MNENLGFRQVARSLDLCHVTLFRYLKKIQAGETPKVVTIHILEFYPPNKKKHFWKKGKLAS